MTDNTATDRELVRQQRRLARQRMRQVETALDRITLVLEVLARPDSPEHGAAHAELKRLVAETGKGSLTEARGHLRTEHYRMQNYLEHTDHILAS